ncbi:glucose-6-phosphate isomerase family protein [Aestuariimicrobium ganziense]|uniref:glucose-6-phosphate isomerase family protein n=1 Tax=Aestuariimicrobium ganziense TaxID=2773677 RepID=UPI0019424649|nr:glucose-6-phosphate isomerase family protein [Aestuariimicrobium ganziense]
MTPTSATGTATTPVPTPVELTLPALLVTGEPVQRSGKTLGELSSSYLDAQGVDPAMPLYAVDVWQRGETAQVGNLFVGMTTLQPGTVNGEYVMTRGHYHQDPNAAEIYVGVAGEGLLLLMTRDGDARTEQVRPGSIHHILGHEAHRLVNTGSEPLKVFAVWPTTAGYDYEAINADGFPVRVFASDAGPVLQPR